MKSESQNVEFKESWRDEYLKWVCGFANASGGRIHIGIDDGGRVVGVEDAERLLEDIPNKIANFLGIVADVNLHETDGKSHLEIVVSPSSVPISYRGAYHYRSGSTKQELKGVALHQFLLAKLNLSWDSTPCPSAGLCDIDESAVRLFANMALRAGRIPEECAIESAEQILRRLHLLAGDGTPTMAALLLFASDIVKWRPTATFRIGRFGQSDSDLISSDEVSVPLIRMPFAVAELLRSKYLTSRIGYAGLQRTEEFEIPETALREMLCNAIVHKDYQSTYIQMKIRDDRIVLWNPGELPPGYTVDTLMGVHESHPRNALIARIFYLAGLIETWGRGYDKIFADFRNHRLEPPQFSVERGGVTATVMRAMSANGTQSGTQGGTQGGMRGANEQNVEHNEHNGEHNEHNREQNLNAADRIAEILRRDGQCTIPELAKACGISRSTVVRAIKSLKESGRIRREGGTRGRWSVEGGESRGKGDVR